MCSTLDSERGIELRVLGAVRGAYNWLLERRPKELELAKTKTCDLACYDDCGLQHDGAQAQNKQSSRMMLEDSHDTASALRITGVTTTGLVGVAPISCHSVRPNKRCFVLHPGWSGRGFKITRPRPSKAKLCKLGQLNLRRVLCPRSAESQPS